MTAHICVLTFWSVKTAKVPDSAAYKRGREGINRLYYYILKNGESLRSANFVRLWTISFPPQTDGTVKLVIEKFLEMVMRRAFQSFLQRH
ncbi:hypothetical protein BDW62DRAFT_192939 [Aspergillus aurantiobrunneus]